MIALFPANPLNPRVVDEQFQAEYEAAKNFRRDLLDLSELEAGKVRIRQGEEVCLVDVVVYRGWMLTPLQYTLLADALKARGTPLLNDADYYSLMCDFPRWYARVDGFTPLSVWIEGRPTDTRGVANVIASYAIGETPLVLKDYLKSQKHYWHEACFIPDPKDVVATKKVIDRFLELQGDSFVGGLVFRQYESFVSLGKTHEQSKFPLIEEYRAFLRHGHVIYIQHMWVGGQEPPMEALNFARDMGRYLLADIPFVALDFARDETGFSIIELGDGGVSSLPHADGPELDLFFHRIGAYSRSYRRP